MTDNTDRLFKSWAPEIGAAHAAAEAKAAEAYAREVARRLRSIADTLDPPPPANPPAPTMPPLEQIYAASQPKGEYLDEQ